MASNIRVVLEVDNKQYIRDIKTAESATRDFARSADTNIGNAGGGFGRLGVGIENIRNKVIGLRTALAGLALSALGRSAIAFADQLQDLSDATGIATGRLLEFSSALQKAGGEPDKAAEAITKLFQKVDEAAQGSIKAQNSFIDLGVSLKDLANLGEQDLLIKTLQGIVKIEDAAARSAKMVETFGKSFRTVDAENLLNTLIKTTGEGDKYAASIARAAEVQSQLEESAKNLKIAFLEAFAKPASDLLAFTRSLQDNKQQVETLVNALKGLATVIAITFAVGGALALVTFIGQVGRAVSVITGFGRSVKVLADGTRVAGSAMGGLFAATGTLMVGLRGVAVAVAALAAGIFTASKLFDDFGSVISNAFARAIEAAGSMIADLLDLLDLIPQGINKIFGTKLGDIGLGAGLNRIVELARKSREEVEKTAAYAKKIGGGRGDASLYPQAVPGEGVAVATGAGVQGTTEITNQPVREVDTTDRQRALAAIKDITKEYEKQQNYNINRINLETSLVGKSEDEVALQQARNKLAEDYANVQDQLVKRRNGLTKDEQYLAGEINKQIKDNAEGYNAQLAALERAVAANNAAKNAERARQDILQSNLTLLQAQEQAQNRIKDAVIGTNQSLRDALRASEFQTQQQGRDPVARRLAEIRQEAENTANSLRQNLAQAFETDEFGMTEGQAQTFIGGLQQIDDATKKLIESQTASFRKSRTWDQGWLEAFNSYKDSAQNAAEQSRSYFDTFTRGVEDAIVRFVQTGKLSFKSLANSLIAEFARNEIKNLLSNILPSGGGGGLGGLISGFFGLFTGRAVGGPVAANSPYLVGERGPELFVPRTAGAIVPNNRLGQQQAEAVTTVNYTIYANDALSFKQQLARDPEFLFAITEQARRQLPARSRR